MTEGTGRDTGGGGLPGGAGDEAGHGRLEEIRARISELDEQLIRLIGERRDLVLEVGRLKEELGLPVLDPSREAAVVRRAAARARELGVDEEMARDVLWRIMAAARQAQEGRSGLPPSPVERPEDGGDDRSEDAGGG